MKTKSLNQNGCSTCEVGKENYTTYKYKGKTYYQYDYRHESGALLSTVRDSLAKCRIERDKFIQKVEKIKKVL